MKANDLLDMIGNTDDGIIEEAKKRKKPAVARWTKWVAVAACLCVVILGVITIPKLKVPTQSENPVQSDNPVQDDSPASATIIFYNNTKYISLIMPEDIQNVGLPETITEDIIGEHVAYLELSGEIADYVETDKETDIELYICNIETNKEVYILRDGDAYWPIAKIEE